MGQVIQLHERRAERARTASAFCFDVCCPLCYLTAECVERTLGGVEWVAVDGSALREPGSAQIADEPCRRVLRERAEAHARALRLPLLWPDALPGTARCAQRACAFACELGAGPSFALAVSRLAFCGGFDLEDPETLAEAAAAAGVPLGGCIAAAGEAWRDEGLADAAAALRACGVAELPALRIDGCWLVGEAGLLTAVGGDPHRRSRRRIRPPRANP